MIPNQDITPMEMFARHVGEIPSQVYLRQPKNGEYLEYTWQQAYERTLRLAQAFSRDLGLQKGDRVGILANNCADWFIADYALVAIGLIPTPIYATAGESVISYVLEHSEAKAIIVGSIAKPEIAQKAIPDTVITIGMSSSSVDWQHSMDELISNNQPLAQEQINQPSLSDIFSIVYTSGSTGKPKGVVISYENICYSAAVSVHVLGTGSQERYLSYLPLAHVTERGLIEYNSLYCGATVTFNESLDTFLNDLRNAQTTAFISIPRLWVKFQSQVLAGIPQRKLSLLLKIPIVSGIIKRKVKAQLGFDNTRAYGSGSAPISPSILQWYQELDIDISEGWGMSETMGLATTQHPFNKTKIGTIGKAVEGFDIKISDSGEVLIKGPGVFSEYYKNPEVTAESFTDDGYFRTGDKADMDTDGYLKITGRVKDIFKSGKGKYVAPVPIESKLASNVLIEQLCVMGSGLPAAMAVIVLSPDVAKGMSKEEIAESLVATVTEVNAQIEKHEVVGGIYITNNMWTIDNGLLTPTMKLKRAELEEKYLPILEDQKETVVWQS